MGAWVQGGNACCGAPSRSSSLHPTNEGWRVKADVAAVRLDCSDRTAFPKWAAGVSQLTAAVDVLTCESQQPTPPCWDSRAAEPLEGCLRGSRKKGCVCVFDATALGASLRTLVFMESCLGIRRGQASCRTSEIPQPFCAQHGADQRVPPFLKCFLSGWNPGPGHMEKETKGPHPQRQGCPSILDRRLKECSIGASGLCLQGWETASSLPRASHILKCV